MRSTTFLRYSLIYSIVVMLGIFASETSTSFFTKIPSILILIIAWFIMVRFYFLHWSAVKNEKVRSRKKELQEQERQERIKSLYKN
jgi:uncharacterized membrane protein YbhN (UPF0104 family)